MVSSVISHHVANNRKSFLPLDTPAPTLVRSAWSGQTRKASARKAQYEICSILVFLFIGAVTIYCCGKGVWW